MVSGWQVPVTVVRINYKLLDFIDKDYQTEKICEIAFKINTLAKNFIKIRMTNKYCKIIPNNEDECVLCYDKYEESDDKDWGNLFCTCKATFHIKCYQTCFQNKIFKCIVCNKLI